jgi:hypothetical protein
MSKPKLKAVSRTPIEGPWKYDAHLDVEQITMSDGSTIYGCTRCDATSATPAGISKHVSRHRAADDDTTDDTTGGQPNEAPQPTTGDHTITVGQVIKALVQVIEPLGDMTLAEFGQAFDTSEEWRERALTAEAELNKIKDVLRLT